MGHDSDSSGPEIAGGCTSVGITKERSTTGSPILAQNEDWIAEPEHIIILSVIPDSGPSILTLSFAGVICHSGINSTQSTRIGNNLHSSNERKLGTPKQVVIRNCLEQSSIHEILSTLRRAERTVSTNHMFCDDSGLLIDVETTADQDRILYPVDGIVTHANDLIHPDLKSLEKNFNKHSSLNRSKRIAEITREKRGKISVSDVKEMLSDHSNSPYSICCHAGTYSDGVHTIGSIICEPANGLVHVSVGQPCQGDFTSYEISR